MSFVSEKRHLSTTPEFIVMTRLLESAQRWGWIAKGTSHDQVLGERLTWGAPSHVPCPVPLFNLAIPELHLLL